MWKKKWLRKKAPEKSLISVSLPRNSRDSTQSLIIRSEDVSRLENRQSFSHF